MRICQVADYYDLGQGGGPFAYCRHLAARGHDVAFLFPTRMDAPREFTRDGVACACFPYPPRSNPLRFLWSSWTQVDRRFRGLDRARAFDAVVLHHPITAFQLLSGGALEGIPSVYFFNSPWSQEWLLNARASGAEVSGADLGPRVQMELRRRVEERNLRHARAVVSQSRFTRSMLFRHHPAFPQTRTRIIPGGVDTDVFRPAADRRAVRTSLGLPADRRVLFTLRRLVPRMGLFNLLSAFQRVRSRCPDTLLVIGGTGPLRASLETAARDMGIADAVRFWGYVPEPVVPRLYQAADLFVLPSAELEGFGYVTIEAYASGLPVVATPVGGSLEVVGGFDRGCLTEGTDVEALGDGIVRVLGDPERMSEAYRSRCRAHALERYTWPRITDEVEAILRSVAGEGRRGAGGRRTVARRVRDANRAVYNAKRFEDYERNESIFAESRQAEIDLRLVAIADSFNVGESTTEAAETIEKRGRGAALTSLNSVVSAVNSNRGKSDGRLLDIGCGTGNVVRIGRGRFRFAAGVDIGWRLLGQARARFPGLPLAGAETERLPFRDGSFRCVTAYAVLHHLLDARSTFREAHRVLAPGGVLYTDHDVNYYFARFYQPVYRLTHLRRAGFGGPDEDFAEYHNTQTAGLDAEALAAGLRRIGFRDVRVEYWHTHNPSLSRPRRFALAALKTLAALTGAKSFYTHFRIVAVK